MVERVGFWRTTQLMRENLLIAQLSASSQSLLTRQQQIASGRRIVSPSTDPVGTHRVLQYDRIIEEATQYVKNVQSGRARLEVTEAALSDMKKLLDQAEAIALRESSDASSTAETRVTAAREVEGLLAEALAIANRKWGDAYLFGGIATQTAPFAAVTNYIAYGGNEREAEVAVAEGIRIPYQMAGASALGGVSRRLGSQSDLNPDITASTLLGDLNLGGGVFAGSVKITRYSGSTATATATIDLSSAQTIQDVLNKINQHGIVTATINAAGTGLLLTGASSTTMTVEEVAGGTTASNLGILQTSQTSGNTLTGSDLDRRVSLKTTLSALNGGSGITDQTSGLVITNGSYSSTIRISSAGTVEEVINAINRAGVYVTAEIAQDGKSIEVFSRLAGARLTVSENGGTTASNLGLLTTASDVHLSQLNNGRGVESREGNDFRITQRDGTTIDVDLGAAATVQDVLNLINNDSENTGDLTASYSTTTNRITITDSSAGSTTLAVTVLNGSYAAANLGIEGNGSGGTLTGSSANPVGIEVPGVFTALLNLKSALTAGDVQEIGLVGRRDLTAAQDEVVEAIGAAGARLARFELAGQRLENELVSFEKLRGEVRDIDVAEAMMKLNEAQNTYYAGLTAAAQLMQMSLLNFLG